MTGRLVTVLSALAVIVGVVIVLATAGWVVPVVHQHCLVRGPTDDAGHVESSWEIVVPILGADDSDTCVRTTVTREAMHSIGLWPLEDPEAQLGLHSESS
jgi:hypothetical protein